MDKIYTEINEILNLLGSSYINKLPPNLYNLILNSKDNNYKVKFKSLDDISTNNCDPKTMNIIALFHLNYWCENSEEKGILNDLLETNFIKNEEIKKEKYNYDNIFKDNKSQTYNSSLAELPIVKTKESVFSRIINKLRNLFHF